MTYSEIKQELQELSDLKKIGLGAFTSYDQTRELELIKMAKEIEKNTPISYGGLAKYTTGI